MKTLLLATAVASVLAAVPYAKAADDFDHRFDRKKTCSGVVTINGTTPESFKDDGSRLIRETDITASCLFSTGTKIGRRIMRTCHMGFGCMAAQQ